MKIAQIFIGETDSEKLKLEDNSPFVFSEIQKTKGKNKDAKCWYLKNDTASQMIKIPKSISCTLEGSYEKTEVFEGSLGLTADMRVSEFTTGVYTMNIRDYLEATGIIMLNKLAFSPYLDVIERDVIPEEKDRMLFNRYFDDASVYVYLVLDTEFMNMLKVVDSNNIMNTFRRAKTNILGCLVNITPDKPLTVYIRDESQFCYKRVDIFINDAEELDINITVELSGDELYEIRGIWMKKNGTRVFNYNYPIMPYTVLSTEDNTNDEKGYVKIPKKCEFDDNDSFIEEIKERIMSANHYMPKAVLLENHDLEYKDLIQLGLQYALVRDGDEIKTIKSN